MALWLSEASVRAVLSMPDLIAAMQVALAAFSAGAVNQPVRTVIDVEANRSFFAGMPAHAPSIPALGAKLVTVFAGNPAQGLPSHLATILLFDPGTGALLAVLDGRYITEARTAAVSAVAVRFLAQTKSKVLAILGSGVQARSHLEALPLVRNFEEIRCWSPTPENLQRFVAGPHERRMTAAPSAEIAVRDADVVVLATSSPSPVLESAWVKDGACVISVGACRPNQREMDPELVTRARVIVDSRESALTESGDIVLGIREGRFTESHIACELGEVISDPNLGLNGGVTVFKSLGLAVEDLAAAHLAYTRALASGKGVNFA